MPSTSTKNRRLSSAFGVSSSACPIAATSWIGSVIAASLHDLAQVVEVVRERARLELRALRGLARLALVARGDDLVHARRRHDRDAVHVEHDRVAGIDRDPADLDRRVELADGVLVGAAHAHPARPDRQPELAQVLDVAHGRVDQHRLGAAAHDLRREQVADDRERAPAPGS